MFSRFLGCIAWRLGVEWISSRGLIAFQHVRLLLPASLVGVRVKRACLTWDDDAVFLFACSSRSITD